MEQADIAAMSVTSRPVLRTRFVALRGPEPTTLLRFHPRLTVLSGFNDGLADWLAGAFEHGPTGAPDGFAVLDGARVALSDLPASVYLEGRCPFVRSDALDADLQHLGRGASDELGFEVSAVTDAIAAARRRSEAASKRIVELDQEIAAAERRVAELQGATPPARRSVVTRDRTEDVEQLEHLVHAIADADALPKETDPDAEAMARAFEALNDAARRHRPRADVEEELRKWELVTAEARARLAERRATAPRVSPEDLAEASRLREAAREANDRRTLLRRRPGEESSAIDAQLKSLLERLGARTYDDLMLMGTGLGSADADLAIREATNVVAAAERRCSDLRSELTRPDIDQLRAERAQLVEQARQLLGGDPGTDPITTLREHRIEPQAVVDAEVALARRLRDLDAHVDGTMVETANRLIDEWKAQLDEHERGLVETQRLEDQLAEAEDAVRQGRTMRARLTREIEARRTEISDLEYDRRRTETRARDANGTVATITPAILDRVVADLFTACESSALPIVVDDPFTALTPELRRRALGVLARRGGANQIVLVTADASTVEWAASAGEDVAIAWTADDARARMRQTV
jgi:hypothetical protein